MENNEVVTGKSITLDVFFTVLKKYWILLIVASLVVAIAIGVFSWVTYEPIWSSTSKFYVSNVADTTYLYSSGQTSGAKEMVANCKGFLEGSVVLDQVLEKIGMEQTAKNRSWLKGLLSVSANEETAIFSVTVSDINRDLTPKITKAIEEVLPAACDMLNNQNASQKQPADENNTPDPSGEIATGNGGNVQADATQSLMLKVIDSGVRDTAADNKSTLIERPIFAGIVTFVLLYVLLLAITLTDMTVYTKRDIREKLPQNVPIFGIIPHWSGDTTSKTGKSYRNMTKKQRLRRQNVEELLINRSNIPFDVEEAFRQLCTNVTFCSTGEKGCVVGVVSTYAASGKSFVMANLAVSLSHQINKKVLLVDADMRCPMTHKIFRCENKSGLSNLLAGQAADYRTVLHHSDNLDVLTSGTIPPNPMELLAGPNMKKLVNEWKQEYDYVLIDLPPVAEVSDAIAISELISGYLFVLRSGISDARAVRESYDALQNRNAKVFGYVLTDVIKKHIGKSYLGYNKYSYHYRYKNTSGETNAVNQSASDSAAK